MKICNKNNYPEFGWVFNFQNFTKKNDHFKFATVFLEILHLCRWNHAEFRFFTDKTRFGCLCVDSFVTTDRFDGSTTTSRANGNFIIVAAHTYGRARERSRMCVSEYVTVQNLMPHESAVCMHSFVQLHY